MTERELARTDRTQAELGRQLKPSAQSIRNWLRQADREDSRRADGLTTEEREEVRRLRREVKALREERDILRKAAAWFARETDALPSRDSSSWKAYQGEHGVATVCRVLGVSASGYYAWRDAYGREAIQIAEALDHPFSVVVGCLDLAYLKSVRGELSQATRLLERAVAQCRDWNITTHTPIAMASLGHVYAWSGRIGEGVSCLQQALAAYESAGIGFHHSLSVEQLGEAYLLADQVENARACADRAVTLARGRGERGNEAWALRLLGDIALHQARPEVRTTAAHYGAAMTLASELDMGPLVAHCHVGLGRLYRRTGPRQQAQEHLTTARAMYGEMGMTYWLEKLENGGPFLN